MTGIRQAQDGDPPISIASDTSPEGRAEVSVGTDKVTGLGRKNPDQSGEQSALGDCCPVPRCRTPLLPPTTFHRNFAGRYGNTEGSCDVFIVMSADVDVEVTLKL